jgi:hypothetical protein
LLSSAEKNTPSRQFEKESGVSLPDTFWEQLSNREKRFAKEIPAAQ